MRCGDCSLRLALGLSFSFSVVELFCSRGPRFAVNPLDVLWWKLYALDARSVV